MARTRVLSTNGDITTLMGLMRTVSLAYRSGVAHRRRGKGQRGNDGGSAGGGGTQIRHGALAPLAVGALVIAVVHASFGGFLMPGAGSPTDAAAGLGAAPRAVPLSPVTATAEIEEHEAQTTSDLTKEIDHRASARRRTSRRSGAKVGAS